MRGFAIFVFWIITLVVCVQVAFTSSVTVGVAAFVASALCYWGAAAFAGALIARRAYGHRPLDLFGIGALALLLIGVGIALMAWSGFWISLFNVRIGGVAWALIGAFSALFVVRLQDAVAGNIAKSGHRSD